MANVVLGWPNYADVGKLYSPTLSGGSWEATLPLTNLQDRKVSKVARSSDALAASTKFEVDLGVARAVRVIALINTNLSSAGTVRVRASSSAGSFGSPIYDSTAEAPYPSGKTAETLEGMSIDYIKVPSAAQTARYWLVEIADTGNADGYVQVGRLVLAGGVQPTINMEQGAVHGVETSTTRTETPGSSHIYNRRPSRRHARFTLRNLPESEAIGTHLELQRIAGTDRQVVLVWDPDDTTLMHHRAYLGTLRQLSALEYPYHDAVNVGYEIAEER